LLSSDRKKRVNLDIVEAPVSSWKPNRGGSLRASALQISESSDLGSTCSSYMQLAASESEILQENGVSLGAAPDFLQNLSC